MKSNLQIVLVLTMTAALPACGAGLRGSPVSAISADSVTLPAAEPASGNGPSPVDTLACDRPVDDFASGHAGDFPAGWETWRDADMEEARRDRAFTVVREHDHSLLRVTSAARELSIGRAVNDWDFRAYPILEWRWRVNAASARAIQSDDAPPLARVGAVWLTGFPFVVRRIEYTWSAGRPLAAQDSSRFGQDRSIVVASSESAVGEWHTIRVDLRRHYGAIFSSEDPDPPAGVAVTAPQSRAGARASVDYRGFRLCRRAVPVADHR
jgi:hypothetical protein